MTTLNIYIYTHDDCRLNCSNIMARERDWLSAFRKSEAEEIDVRTLQGG